ncbi:helix-turn-helix domain-containing protein [Hymenobacter chitinivorans]|uniref:Helix-turn-helix protein n=1 Tax=Hymenobacter chitinivorans DSM 11115 TaxID=1121954 RepID=A0A2M9BQZ2_9BACT|nr:hypothetical protein [Hymenobacter chitinivorans]PJJ60373.1 hypothetical protein CLV45_1799 [Hymenobacter chitinivorans DSM 11115]
MARRARNRTTLVFRVRTWFGLQQDELALYLGVSKATVQSMESQRVGIGPAVSGPLLLLLAQLPPPVPATAETAAMPLPPPPTELVPNSAEPPEAAELDFRRRVCLYQAAGLKDQADKLALQAATRARWAQALPALLAAYPAPTTEEVAADDDALRHHAWLLSWLHFRARPLPAADVTRWHLLQARIAALETEAAALAATLATLQSTSPSRPQSSEVTG